MCDSWNNSKKGLDCLVKNLICVRLTNSDNHYHFTRLGMADVHVFELVLPRTLKAALTFWRLLQFSDLVAQFLFIWVAALRSIAKTTAFKYLYRTEEAQRKIQCKGSNPVVKITNFFFQEYNSKPHKKM